MITKWVDRISYISNIFASVVIVLMVLLILAEVLFRLTLGKSTLIAQEFTGYLLVFFVFVSLGYVLKKDRHIKITLITTYLPPKYRNITELTMYLVTFFMVIYMFYWSLDLTFKTFERHEYAETVFETPLFIPKSFIPIGLFVFALQIAASMVARINKIRNGHTNSKEGKLK